MWILLITAIYGGRTMAMQNTSFQSEKACIAARTKLSEHYDKLGLSHSLLCVESYK